MNIPTKTKKLTAILLVTLFLTAFVSPFLPQAHAAVTALTVSPKEGKVDDTIGVNGTIETTGGNYSIFFDSVRVIGGVASSTGFFVTSFKVPRATNGTHTITLQDAALNHNATEPNFKVITSYSISAPMLLVPPKQPQEGDTVTILAQILGADANRSYQQNITITTPANTVFFNSTLSLLTDQNGTATRTLYYPTDFQPINANTDYTGTYQLRIFKNATTVGAQSTFFVGLTNATRYQRFEWVNIRATNYMKPNENATVTIKLSNITIASQKIQAMDGTITYNWQVPVNAKKGSYKVTVATAIQDGTVKSVPDAQNFTLPSLLVKILTTNLSGEPLSGVNATAYENVQNGEVTGGLTNSSGWTVNTLDRGGNYTLKAFWKNAQVNTTSVYIPGNSSWTLTCQITHIEFTIKDGKTALPMPFIVLTLNARYHDATNTTISAPQQNFVTNDTGKWTLRNQLVNANYTVHAYRTQLLFNTTTFTPAQNQKQLNMSITCPLLGLTVHAEDAKQTSLGGYPVKIYEFAGGLYANSTTSSAGNVTFSAIFGTYKVRLYNPEETVILNETYYNLINASAFFIIRSDIYHANLSVRVLDYFGQPMANVRVKLERESTTPVTLNTDGSGVAFFEGITGGDCFVSVYVGSDTPSETATVFVDKDTTLTLTLGTYVSIFGLIVDTGQFAILVIFIAFIVLFIAFLLYRRRNKAPTEKTAGKES